MDWIDPDQSPENENKAFEKAMALAGSEFLDVRFLKMNEYEIIFLNYEPKHHTFSTFP